jgi:small subunit ribosomal protein S1
MPPSQPSRDPKESFASLFEKTEGAGKRRRQYHTGETVEVTVVAVAREAVFADLGGKQEGMFERTALVDGEGKVRVEVGARISAVVSGIDSATGQVRLTPVVVRASSDAEGAGSFSLSAAPAGGAASLLVEGARVKGKVTGIERYGIFVQLAGTSGRSGRGLVPTSETATPRAADLKKHFSLGQEIEAKILNVDETGKIRLSISALRADEERGQFESYAKAERNGSGGDAGGASGASGGAKGAGKPAPAPRNFGTLGDLLAKKVKR